ncbi:putative RNA recognition motif domain, nucleotide-binding alpha-beta plait domain superfamily [Helianthus annuus]|nr:putative RNA recognition motif domain, nucleotide-binding alpha-beta plait domain superfamily [Helianthus annuus]
MDGDPRSVGSRNVTKFFISNLPEGCTPWELKCGLAGYGDVTDTYVAKKRDKDGCRFGFASFKDVKDKSGLVRSLRGVSLGGCKLKVNIARFALENGSDNRNTVGGIFRFNMAGGGDSVNPSHVNPGGNVRTASFRDRRSYSDVLGKGKEKEVGLNPGFVQEVGKQVVAPDRTAAMQEYIGVAVVGRTVDLETLVDLDRLLRIAKVSYGKIQYLGGLSVLISFSEEPASRLFIESRELWGPWFSKLSAWDGQSLSFEKVAWLRFIGLPLHLLDRDVIKLVGEPFGKILHVQKDFENADNLSFVRVGVLSGFVERIKEVITLKWKDRNYRILVEEELDVWIPDCLGGMSGVSPAVSSPLASSPVVRVAEPEVGDSGFEEDEEVGLDEGSSRGDVQTGGSPKGGGSGNVFNDVQFNWQPFLESCIGEGSNSHGDDTQGIMFFKARKKSKRRHKRGTRNHYSPHMGSPINGVESSEKARPTKRNRALLEEESDPFSLDRLLAQSIKNSDNLSSYSCMPDVNLNVPLDSSGVPMVGVHRASAEISSTSPETLQRGQ